MDRVDLGGPRVVVHAGHPWRGQPGVDTVGDPQIVRELTVLALVSVVTPIIDLCHSLTRVGRAGLWNEVGDSLGTAVAFQSSVPVNFGEDRNRQNVLALAKTTRDAEKMN